MMPLLLIVRYHSFVVVVSGYPLFNKYSILRMCTIVEALSDSSQCQQHKHVPLLTIVVRAFRAPTNKPCGTF